MMNGKGKNDCLIHTDFDKKDEFNLHYQFFPEDRITTVFLEDPLPCPKKTKKKGVIQRKKRIARRLLRSERTILRKEWKKWQRQLSKQSQRKSSGLQPTLKNSRYNRTMNLSSKPVLTNSQSSSNKSSVLMPPLKRPLGEMTVPELVKYKNDLNNYLKYVCNKNCSSNSNIIKVNSKSEKNDKLRLSKPIKLLISLDSVDKEEVNEKCSDSPNNYESDELTCDNGMGEQMEMASELIAEGIRLLNRKSSKECPLGGPNIKELSQLIRKLRHFQSTFDRPMFKRSLSSKSFQNKVVSVHAPPSKLQHPPSRKIEPQIKACDFPFNKICKADTEKDGMPWVKETIKNSKKMLRKNNLLPSDIAEMTNNNLTCDSKIWLKIENLLDEKNNVVDLFVNKVMEKLRKSAD